MKRLYRSILPAVVCAVLSTAAAAQAPRTVSGAGATFPYPLYAKWAEAYKETTGVTISYQPIGSGLGIERIKTKAVDFGASDMPLKPEDLEKLGLMQFPTVVGGTVPVVNIPGIKSAELKVTGQLLADIYLGKVTNWNDPAIRTLNRELTLPDLSISVAHRRDGSGTTFIWVNYLSKVSPEWKTKVGEGTTVAWPTGTGRTGNEGVAEYVQTTPGAIGYVEYANAMQSKLVDARVQNRYGVFVAADIGSFRAAAANAEWGGAPGFYLLLTDQLGRNAWPISGATFILMHKTQQNAQNARAVLEFFEFSYRQGWQTAMSLHYSPLPLTALGSIRSAWKQQLKDAAGRPVWQ